jgi:hypothetical protein
MIRSVIPGAAIREMVTSPSHAFHPGVLETPVRRNLPHKTVIDPQFFAEHRDFRFKLANPCVFQVAVLDHGFAPREHRNANEANDIEGRSKTPGMASRRWPKASSLARVTKSRSSGAAPPPNFSDAPTIPVVDGLVPPGYL